MLNQKNYVSSWNKRRACLNVVYPVFFRRLRELWHNSGENINSQIFAKQMSWSSVTLFLNIPSKAQEKILNPPKTANNQREIYILQAYMRWTCVRNSQSSCFPRTSLPNPKFRPPNGLTFKSVHFLTEETEKFRNQIYELVVPWGSPVKVSPSLILEHLAMANFPS